MLVLEHKRLYRSVRGPVPGRPPRGADRRGPHRPAGHRRHVVTYGAGVDWAVAAADVLAAEGAGEVEVIDLRSLRPWDRDTVLDSVRRTSRVLVLHEARLTGGFGAEIAATIADEAFMDLDAPGPPGRRARHPHPLRAHPGGGLVGRQPAVTRPLRELLAF